MGRLTTCLLVLATVATPAFAGTGRETSAPDGPGAIRLVSAFGVITSTWRSSEHNRAVGGVPNSYHLHAQAMDVVRRPGVTHRQIDAALRSAGYNLIESLDEGDHSHFAFGPSKAGGQPVPAAILTPPPAPLPPAPPRLLADEHGTLLVDAETQTVDLDGSH